MAGLYLASQSPRRTELLTQVGIDHTVVSSTYEMRTVRVLRAAGLRGFLCPTGERMRGALSCPRRLGAVS